MLHRDGDHGTRNSGDWDTDIIPKLAEMVDPCVCAGLRTGASAGLPRTDAQTCGKFRAGHRKENVVISSRRLAREWALKTLYQMDVGKVALREAEDGALERLRKEFVERGSRTASGSPAEAICLDLLTASIRDTLSDMRPVLERAFAGAAGRLLGEYPYWQEIRLERSWRSQLPGIRIQPARLLLPLSYAEIMGPVVMEGASPLTETEHKRLRAFVDQARQEIPARFEAGLRVAALAFARELSRNRPIGATPSAMQDYLVEKRQAYNREGQERWKKIGDVVQKQTADWLRTAAFTLRLVNGTQQCQADIDLHLSALSAGWSLDRQVSVDRNILRLAAYEMLFVPEIPASASINEAVELAKKYSTAESGRFVNGVLGGLLAKIGEKPTAAEDTDDAPLDLPDLPDLEDQEFEDTTPS